MFEPDIFHECERFARRLIGVREGHPARDYSAGGVVTIIVLLYCYTIRVVWGSKGHSEVRSVALCSLLAAISQFSVLINQKMRLTGWRNSYDMRNTTSADTQTSIEWPYTVHSLCCDTVM